MLTLAAMVLLAGSPLLSFDAAELSYFNPQGSDRTSLSYRYHGSGSIPLELGEKLLTEASGADTLIVVVNGEYSAVQEQVLRLIAQEVGIAEEQSNSSGLTGKQSEQQPSFENEYPTQWPPLGVGLSIFSDVAHHFNRPREYQLTSRPYNQLKDIEGYSEVRIRVTDGKELLGKDVTILQIGRRDYSMERARFHHSMPIPLWYKERHVFTVVTDTEVMLIEKLKQRIHGLVIRYIVPTSRISRSWDNSYREDFLAGLMKVAAEF
jgi:hypothetical protein